jgi:hypothetical protein
LQAFSDHRLYVIAKRPSTISACRYRVVEAEQIATMKKIIKTWELVTVDGRRVFIGECGEATLESGSNKAFGVREIKGERPSNDQKRTAEEVSKRLGVECVWKPGSDSVEDHG